MSIDRAALLAGSIRLASGVQFLVDPLRANRLWGDYSEPSPTARLLLRSMGYRDALIGGLLLTSGLRGKNSRGWFLASAGADASDLLGGLSVHDDLTRSQQLIGLGGAILGVGVGLWGAARRTTRASEAPAPECRLSGSIGNTGAVRFSAWIWVFSSTHNTKARSGGFKYRPTTSRTLATNKGSLDSFQESCLCGANPNARHTRETIDWLKPRCSAIDRVDHCVASRGTVSSVAVINSSIRASSTMRGRPGRGSSRRPSRRSTANRLRHLVTIPRVTPNSRAICVLLESPSQARTMRERNAKACALLGRRTHACNCSRSSSLNTTLIATGLGTGPVY